MMKIIEYALSLPKSVYFCLKTLPLSAAVHLPILVRYNVSLRSIGKIEMGGAVLD
mgnify:CR=1 FL=1